MLLQPYVEPGSKYFQEAPTWHCLPSILVAYVVIDKLPWATRSQEIQRIHEIHGVFFPHHISGICELARGCGYQDAVFDLPVFMRSYSDQPP